MTIKAIARLRELRAKATAGRLLALPEKPNWDVYWHVTDGEDFVCQLYSEHCEFDNAKANAAAIVAAMNSLESLLACAEALRVLSWHYEELATMDGDVSREQLQAHDGPLKQARLALQALAEGGGA